ncbi:cytochrome b [Sphingomonas sp. RS6]
MNARRPRAERYSTGAIAFHWVIALLVLINLAIGILHESLPRGWQVMPLHKSIGITVLALTFARILWRLTHRPPPLPAASPAWEKASATIMHLALYAATLILPLTGWLMGSNPERLRPLSWFGLFRVPPLPSTPGLSGGAHEAHELLGWAMLLLVAIHVAAALRHHLLLRDAVMLRMMPRR